MSFVLGIDLGTSNVKIVVVNKATRKLEAQAVETHCADVFENVSENGSEQNVSKIFSAIEKCMLRLEQEFRHFLTRIQCVAVCGQMHGCTLWNSSLLFVTENVELPLPRLMQKIIREEICISRLITWQDRRTDEQFINGLPIPDSHLNVHSGFGCLSLLWLKRNDPKRLKNFDAAGTVADFFVACLCHLHKTSMSVQNGASWGYFDVESATWNRTILESVEFPVEFLPSIVDSHQPAGRLYSDWHGIPEKTLVFPAFGDFQCTVYSKLLDEEHSAILNIGTSSQLSFRMPQTFRPPKIVKHLSQSVVYFPYFKNDYLAVAASLNGGNVLSEFAKVLTNWSSLLSGEHLLETVVLSKVLSLVDTNKPANQKLTITPTLFGERHNPLVGFCVENVFASGDVSLKNFTENLLESVIINLDKMMPKNMLKENNIDAVILCGQASKSYFKNIVERLYDGDMEILVDDVYAADAALGCALFALNSCSTD